jgi:RND family efflux transporter MFP subunit
LISLLVKPGEYVSVGQPIATVSQNRRLQLRAEVSERYFDRLGNITSANFILPYRPDETLSLSELNGRVVSFGKASAAGSYYLPVIFEFDNTGNVIPGSYAEIYLLGAPRKGVISVPKGAIAEEQGLYFVFVETSAEHFEKREVKLGANNGTSVEVKSGIKSGEKVVVAGAIHVKMAGLSSAIPHGHSH